MKIKELFLPFFIRWGLSQSNFDTKFWAEQVFVLLLPALNRRKRSEPEKKFFYIENGTCHKSFEVMAKLHKIGFKLLPHMPRNQQICLHLFHILAVRGPEKDALEKIILNQL